MCTFMLLSTFHLNSPFEFIRGQIDHLRARAAPQVDHRLPEFVQRTTPIAARRQHIVVGLEGHQDRRQCLQSRSTVQILCHVRVAGTVGILERTHRPRRSNHGPVRRPKIHAPPTGLRTPRTRKRPNLADSCRPPVSAPRRHIRRLGWSSMSLILSPHRMCIVNSWDGFRRSVPEQQPQYSQSASLLDDGTRPRKQVLNAGRPNVGKGQVVRFTDLAAQPWDVYVARVQLNVVRGRCGVHTNRNQTVVGASHVRVREVAQHGQYRGRQVVVHRNHVVFLRCARVRNREKCSDRPCLHDPAPPCIPLHSACVHTCKSLPTSPAVFRICFARLRANPPMSIL